MTEAALCQGGGMKVICRSGEPGLKYKNSATLREVPFLFPRKVGDDDSPVE